MTKVFFQIVVGAFLVAPNFMLAQEFRVQIAAYAERQPETFFNEKGIVNYSEIADKSGIYWYSAGQYPTWEAAETVRLDAVNKGFVNALVIDEEAQRIISGMDCPYIRDGVVFVHEPNDNPSEHTIYFDFGKSSLDTESRSALDEVYQKLKQTPGLILKIKGFTDGVGDGKDNMKLAATRSRSARDYLIFKGVRADRMFMEVFGEAEPAAPNAEDDGSNAGKGRDLPGNRKWNRRVTLTLEMPAKNPKALETPK
jgi:outer membrane protein OmpA-like peptidoglycan-associated protein